MGRYFKKKQVFRIKMGGLYEGNRDFNGKSSGFLGLWLKIEVFLEKGGL